MCLIDMVTIVNNSMPRPENGERQCAENEAFSVNSAEIGQDEIPRVFQVASCCLQILA